GGKKGGYGAARAQPLPQRTAAQHHLTARHKVRGHGPERQRQVANVALSDLLPDRRTLLLAAQQGDLGKSEVEQRPPDVTDEGSEGAEEGGALSPHRRE